MKPIKNITLCGLIAVGTSFVMSSCEDFLTITPTTSIVEEEFWQDKNDLNNAITACYKRMVSDDLLNTYIYWGEERSDNLDRPSTSSATGAVANIMNGNLLPTYGQFNWVAMYNVINYCNKVLVHGPEVLNKDESFSESDWLPIHAEAVTLRALCHFWLVRTFGEIPYVTIDYNNDSQELRLPQSTQLAVLDSIVTDLESVKNEAMIDYNNVVYNKGRITKKAVYALLADVYLWRASYKEGGNQPFKKIVLPSSYNGTFTEAELSSRYEEYSTSAEDDYRKCIECCDFIIDMVTQEKIDYINKSGLNIGGGNVEIELADLLETNEISGNNRVPSTSSSGAYNAIFGRGNSDESIFELQVDGVSYYNNMPSNLFFSTTVGTFTSSSILSALEERRENNDPNTSSVIFPATDYRCWESLLRDESQNIYNIGKYVQPSVDQYNLTTRSPYLTFNAEQGPERYERRTTLNANWIFYRLSEIYLFKAEAMSQLYSDEENLAEAFKYVREVFKRSNPYAYQPNNSYIAKDTLNFAAYFNSQEDMELLVMKERQREFVAEGKRWFDLVRYALRRGGTSEMLNNMLIRKYNSGTNAIKAKLADIQSLFSPVYNNELKNNTWLYQNGVWNVNETTSRTDDI